jgi:hypothetical protein
MKHARDDYNRIQDPAKKIPEEEPVFLLRAQDELASLAVDYWADLMESNGGDPELIRLAREHAAKMAAWPNQKMADL